MKKLTAVCVSLILGASLLQAKDKDYGVDINTDNLKVGKSNIEIYIKSKTIPVSNANVKLKVYHPDNSITIHKTNKTIKGNKYILKFDTLKKGTYKYLLKFNRMGGVNHIRRGTWEL